MKVTQRRALAGVFALILAGGITGSFRPASPDTLPRCLDSSLVAFETAQSPQEAATVWSGMGATQPNLARSQYADFAFIAAYAFLFLLLAAIARQRPIWFSRIAGGAAVASTIVTVAADMGENLSVLGNIVGLKHGLPDAGRIALMRYFSLTKWAACGVTLVLLWWAFVPSRRGSALYRLLALTIGVFAVVSGAMGILGWWDNPKVELVIPFLIPALLLQIPLFGFFWEDVIGGHAVPKDHPIESWGT